jgi:hypothetical protein
METKKLFTDKKYTIALISYVIGSAMKSSSRAIPFLKSLPPLI